MFLFTLRCLYTKKVIKIEDQVEKYKVYRQTQNIRIQCFKNTTNECFSNTWKPWSFHPGLPRKTSVSLLSPLMVYSGFVFAALKSLNKSTHTTKSNRGYLSFSVWRMIWRSTLRLFLPKQCGHKKDPVPPTIFPSISKHTSSPVIRPNICSKEVHHFSISWGLMWDINTWSIARGKPSVTHETQRMTHEDIWQEHF